MFPKLSNVHYSLLLERNKNQMEVRYFDFQFLEDPSGNYLQESLSHSFTNRNPSKFVQVAEFNTDWSFFNYFQRRVRK